MDRRSWPWKKKSANKADKVAAANAAAADAAAAALASARSKGDQDYKKPDYVKISLESYVHLTGLEDQAKTYEDRIQDLEEQITELDEKLFEAKSEITTKDNLIKQHSKVGEEAVAGWEKAEAEALALKNQLEVVTLSKLTAEDRAAHLDGALKESIRQIRNLKEEHEQKMQDFILIKTKQCDKMRLDLEAKIGNLEQQLLHAENENASLSRSLQESSNMIIKIGEEKSRVEEEAEVLKIINESCEKEINSHKYELHVMSKEMEIRNEEKNMSMRSAEVANKQYIEGAKKIAKLEAECQRLRGLVRKKLPGPAVIAQMKLEVENFGRRSPVRPSSPRSPQISEFSFENVHHFQKDSELLIQRLSTMEEEMNMLKEALVKRNGELQASRDLCAKTASKVQDLEEQLQLSNQNTSHLCQNTRSPPSLTSMSEGNEEDNSEGLRKSDNGKNLELMDDFLEMEKLACESNDTNANGVIIDTNSHNSITSENKLDLDLFVSSNEDLSPTANLRSRISMVFDSVSNDAEMDTNVEDIETVIQDKTQVNGVASETVHKLSQEMLDAISQIHDYILLLGKEYISSDINELRQKIVGFSATFNKVSSSVKGLDDFIFDLSRILTEASKVCFKNSTQAEPNSPDCVDKTALPENKIVQNNLDSCPTSDHEISDDGELNARSWKLSLKEFEDLISEKDSVAYDLARSSENLELTNSRLHETEQHLEEVNLQLALAQKSNILAETQLKCMVESYRSLEARAEKLEAEVNILRAETENLENELQDERSGHEDAIGRCNELQEQLQRSGSCSVCSAVGDNEDKTKQEQQQLAEKLAECQETIFLLGKQLNSMRIPTEFMGSPFNEESQKGEEESTWTGMKSLDFEEATSVDTEAELERSPIKSKKANHRSTKSTSSSCSSTPTPEKQSRGFSRFFSSK